MTLCSRPDPGDSLHGPHPFLRKALDSVLAARKAEEALVVPDDAPDVEILVGIDGPRPLVERAVVDWCRDRGVPRFGTEDPRDDWRGVRLRLFTEYPHRGGWGHALRNDLLARARGDLVHCSDHDDAYFPDSLRGVARLAREHPGVPLVCKMRIWCFGDHTQPMDEPDVLWKTRGRVEEGHIGGHQVIAPNRQELLGRFLPADFYAADFRYVKSTLDNFAAAGLEAHWSDGFISSLRPWTAGRLY